MNLMSKHYKLLEYGKQVFNESCMNDIYNNNNFYNYKKKNIISYILMFVAFQALSI